MKEREAKPLMDHIMNSSILKRQGLANQFAYYLGPAGGSMTFGGADLSRKASVDDEFVFAPVNNNRSYWGITVLGTRKQDTEPSVSSKAKSTTVQEPREGIIDTGTYLIYAPREVWDEQLQSLNFANCKNKDALPNIMLQLQGAEDQVIQLVLTPRDYVLDFQSLAGDTTCMIGIRRDDQMGVGAFNGWTLGQVFLRGQFYQKK